MNGLLEQIKSLFQSDAPDVAKVDNTTDVVALAALMIISAKADGEFADEEREAILRSLKRQFELSDEEAKEILVEAKKAETHAIDIHAFTRILAEGKTYEDRMTIVKQLFPIVGADGTSDFHEEEKLHKIAAAMGITARDFGRLRSEMT